MDRKFWTHHGRVKAKSRKEKIENGNHDVACNGFSVSSVADMLIQQQLI